MPRLKTEKVKKIKADLCKPIATQPAVAKKHRVSRSAVSDIATGRTHKNVPWPEGGPPRKRSGGQRKPVGDYDPTNARILELEADIAHLTEERNRERRKAKAGAKERGLFNAMADVLTEKIVAVKPLPKMRKAFSKKNRIEEHAVLHLSDGHHDQVVLPEECGGLETYDFPISCCRAERLVDTTLQWTQQILGGRFYFPVLNILSYGDHTSGEIHGATDRGDRWFQAGGFSMAADCRASTVQDGHDFSEMDRNTGDCLERADRSPSPAVQLHGEPGTQRPERAGRGPSVGPTLPKRRVVTRSRAGTETAHPMGAWPVPVAQATRRSADQSSGRHAEPGGRGGSLPIRDAGRADQGSRRDGQSKTT